MLKLTDLALRPDVRIGPVLVSPSRRLVEGPGGHEHVEPLIMQVFLLLLDSGGRVVTRNELFDHCWGGVFVGDDSLNRAIAKVRRTGAKVAPGLFEIETIPRTGYRLTGPILDQLDETPAEERDEDRAFSRRTLIAAGAASLAALGGGGWWLAKSASDERRFDELLKRGREGLEFGGDGAEPAKYLQQAIAIRPDDAAAQGLLAFAIMGSADNVNKGEGGTVDAAQEAAAISLRADPKNVEARLAQIQLERATLDLAGTEDRLRAVLASAPNNIFVMRLLWHLLTSTGRSREALGFVERAISVKPLAAGNNFPLAQLLWITGRTAEADRIIDRAMNFWPTHPYVRFARFTIFAFTGRARTALAMLENPDTRPQAYSPQAVALWRKSLPVLEEQSPSRVTDLRATYVDAVKRNPKVASQAVLVLSALGEVDAAFDIANNLFLFRTPGSSSSVKVRAPRAGSTSWRFTPWLFTPPVASMRADPRFLELCDGIGLTDYWRARGVRPDYQLSKA